MGNEPTINVTRGRRNRPRRSAAVEETSSSESALPGPMDVVSGLARGMRSMWLAGLGAVGMVEDVVSGTFDALVEEGKTWHRTRAEERAQTARRIEQLREEGDEPLESVETRVRAELDGVLRQVGIARRDEVEALRTEVDTLEETIDRLHEALEKSGRGTRSTES